MCEVSERVFREGEAERTPEMAIRLAGLGVPADKIAQAAEVAASVVTQWIDDRTATVSGQRQSLFYILANCLIKNRLLSIRGNDSWIYCGLAISTG